MHVDIAKKLMQLIWCQNTTLASVLTCAVTSDVAPVSPLTGLGHTASDAPVSSLLCHCQLCSVLDWTCSILWSVLLLGSLVVVSTDRLCPSKVAQAQ